MLMLAFLPCFVFHVEEYEYELLVFINPGPPPSFPFPIPELDIYDVIVDGPDRVEVWCERLEREGLLSIEVGIDNEEDNDDGIDKEEMEGRVVWK